MRTCNGPGKGERCPNGALIPKGRTYCDDCGRVRDRARGTRQARGYDRAHELRRAADLPHAYGKPCPYCSIRMWPHDALDWDHTVEAITHASCNRSEGATRGNRDRA